MIKRKLNTLVSAVFIAITFTSCNNKEELTEVQIPEREAFITKTTVFPEINTIKTEQGPFDMLGIEYSFTDYAEVLKAESVYSHYAKFHLSYANKLNTTIHGTPFEKDSISYLVKRVYTKEAKLKDLTGAYYNHNIYWKSLSPIDKKQPSEALKKAIRNSFGSMAELKREFTETGSSFTGSGWLWLVEKNGELKIVTTTKNDSPNMPELSLGNPLLGIDLWEHAYYSTYENDLNKYLRMCFDHLNWDYASNQYEIR